MNYTKDYRNLNKMMKDYMDDYEKIIQKSKLIKIKEYQEQYNYKEYENKEKKFAIMFDNFINYNAEEDNIIANKLIENISDELDGINILKNENTKKDYEMRIKNDELQKNDSQDQLNQNCYLNENEIESEGGLNENNNNKISEHSNENENHNNFDVKEEDEFEKKESEKNYIKEKENNKNDKGTEKNYIKEKENNKSDKLEIFENIIKNDFKGDYNIPNFFLDQEENLKKKLDENNIQNNIKENYKKNVEYNNEKNIKQEVDENDEYFKEQFVVEENTGENNKTKNNKEENINAKNFELKKYNELKVKNGEEEEKEEEDEKKYNDFE